MSKIESILRKMKGRTFMYKTREIRVLNTYLEDGMITIATEDKYYQFPETKAAVELRNFLPVDGESQEMSLAVLPKSGELINLKNTVMDTIKKVQQDKTYIPQANAVNKGVDTLLKLAKVELSYLKIMKSAK